ncbi:hypothetical protein C2S51_007803 [Perilla frutescens var. frutescens]|nr:hypothetical protein C2S51_007803 [Perilla frutescens var. frutescens]
MLHDASNTYFALISKHRIPSTHSISSTISSSISLESPTDFEFPSYIEILDNESILWSRYNANGRNVMPPEGKFSQGKNGKQQQMGLRVREGACKGKEPMKVFTQEGMKFVTLSSLRSAAEKGKGSGSKDGEKEA